MTVAYNGRPNQFGASLFVASLLLLVVGLGSGLAAIIRLLWAEPASRRWARGAAAFGVFGCAALAGVAVTPENRVMAIHVTLTVWAWRLVPLVAALMALATLQSPLFRRRMALLYVAHEADRARRALRAGSRASAPSRMSANSLKS